jgi:hypothetical protein
MGVFSSEKKIDFLSGKIGREKVVGPVYDCEQP